MVDRFPEQSEIDFTSLVDQKSSENTKKATRTNLLRRTYNIRAFQRAYKNNMAL